MPKYRDTDLQVRCTSIMIHNPDSTDNPAAKPMVDFQRELVVAVAGERGKRPLTSCRVVYTEDNLNTSVPVIDPATDLPTGDTFTYADFYKYFYSIFAKVSVDQDTADVAREQLIALANQAGMQSPII